MPRRTQVERSAATRAALLEATLECLAEHGYSGTSTTEIVRRAGVSRGAQVHHFPTKASLVEAAARHLYTRREAEFFAAFESLPPGEQTPSAAIDLLWSFFSGPSSSASVELIVAARTDPALGPVVSQVMADFEATITAGFARVFPDVATGPFGPSMVMFAFSLMTGAALYRDGGLPGRAEETVGLLRVLADSYVSPTSNPLSPQGATP